MTRTLPRRAATPGVALLRATFRPACRRAFLLIGTLVLPAPAVGQFEEIRTRIQQLVASDDIPSIAVAVASRGEILWEEGFGWADRERGLPAGEHVMYPLASVTKPLTATGLMVLEERGLLDLDRGVNEYIGDPPLAARVGDAADVTPRLLANHTSGLPGHIQLFYADEPDRAPPSDALIGDHGVVVNVPGERRYYSNLNFGVLGHLVSRVARKRFADFMREDVFLPLGMTRSSIGIRPGMDSVRAVRYSRGDPWPDYETDTPGATDGYSSAHDLISFALFHMKHGGQDGPALLSEQAIDLMQRPTSPGPDGEAYGVGWLVQRRADGLLRVGHDGGLAGETTRLAMYPEQDLAIVLLSNTNTGLGELERMIVEAMLTSDQRPDPAEELAEEPAEEPAAPTFDPGEPLIGVWRGHVEVGEATWPVTLDIRPDGDVRLVIQEPATRYMGGEMWTVLNRVTFRDGVLEGFALPGNWTSVPYRHAFMRRLDLTLGSDVLYGSLALYESSVHTSRSDTLLSYWVTLTRER